MPPELIYFTDKIYKTLNLKAFR